MSDQQTTRFHGMNPRMTAAALLLAIFAAVVAVLGVDIDARASTSIRIGVLAHKGTDICRQMWQPTMVYLGEALPGRQFDLVPLQFEEIEPAVKNKSIDFLICNPAIYVDLEVRYGVSRIMTLRNLVGTQIVSEFGGVVFCRADRSDLQGLRDARGQRLAATGQTSFGGWYMALREFRSAGIDPERDCARIVFLNSHPAVVRAVLSGEADIGTVRTDTIERMAANGEIRMDAVRVIPANVAPGSRSTFPYLHSTRLYPEWPFAKLSDTTENLSRELTVALLSMPADSPAAIAAQSGGWGVCLNYTSVHDCLRELRLPPYELYGRMSWSDMWRQYWPWLVAITALIIALLVALLLLRGRHLAVMMVSGQNRLLLASVGDGICGIDIDGITTFVNPAANKMLGYTTEELLGKNLHALTHHTKPDGLPYPRIECPIYMACNDGTVHQGSDEFFYHKDGSAIPVSYSSRPMVEMGRISGAVICFEDITERKRAEDELQKRETTIQAVLDTAPVGICIMKNRLYQRVNKAWCESFGYREENIIGRTTEFLYESHEEYERIGNELYENTLKKGIGFARARLKRSDGEFRDVDLTAKPLGTEILYAGTVVVVQDITERKQAEKALRESEEKYRSMMEAMDDAAYICSSDFRVEYQNTAMIKWIGHDATGELCYKVMYGLGEKCPWCIHEKIMRGEYLKTEVVSPKNGKTYHISNSPIYHTDGSVSKLAIFRDITETKKMAARLDQAQRMEAIGALAGGIAHDFNNILFPIIGMSDMLMEDLPAGSLNRENVGVIFKAAMRAGDLVKQILSFSRQADHVKIPVRVQHILKEVLKLTRSTIPSNIEISQSIQSGCGLVMADPTQLHQIAMNLITNAYHAVEEAGGSISVQLKESVLTGKDWVNASLEPGKYAVITVWDTGHGIDPAVMGKIFEPYFTTKEVGKGTGLGLSVVHGIVKDHGGDIRVCSEPGKGTTFNVYLPIIKDDTETVTTKELGIYKTGTERILLVDDEEPIVLLEQMMLEKLGYQITVRTSSPDALHAFRANPSKFDLVISDRGMPNMTGEQLARELISIKPGIPIIICTGFSDENDEKRAKAMGIKEFLMKPVSLGDLAVTVRKVLDDVADSVLVHKSGQADAITPAERQLKNQDNG